MDGRPQALECPSAADGKSSMLSSIDHGFLTCEQQEEKPTCLLGFVLSSWEDERPLALLGKLC